jgi:hypothetical protein
MNLQEQIGTLEASVDDLIRAAAAAATSATPADSETAVAAPPDTRQQTRPVEPTADDAAQNDAGATGAREAIDAGHGDGESPADATNAPGADDATPDVPNPTGAPATPDAKPALHVERPNQNEIALSINGQTVSLHPLQVGQLIEELANARASMQPEVPANLPPGWRFVSTKNPMMAVQKQSNGDRLLVMRHTGHGWVPFTFSPDMIVQMYMMLTQA